ncbi:hypothetical protein JAAARDRAFT_40378 [Jaapia argillacea MUCL 33604]|uniref:Uncharacterized protein n=1 Tax=Jaapia argillacea MUCL 33604 TaxID=933084 RepID=A0A067PBU7_9AGAM|nr:hypothetical protein JAAARDRAFT_40378 [Jaapia argillacea MUCL 33604]
MINVFPTENPRAILYIRNTFLASVVLHCLHPLHSQLRAISLRVPFFMCRSRWPSDLFPFVSSLSSVYNYGYSLFISALVSLLGLLSTVARIDSRSRSPRMMD